MIWIRCSTEERERWRELAEERRTTVSALVRKALALLGA
jgi:hypothetical protein